MIPFTLDQFLDTFGAYNQSVWPAQIFLNALAVVMVILALRKRKASSAVVPAGLAVLWLWMGIVYHFLFFLEINRAAYLFGSLYVIQAVIFLFYGLVKRVLTFQFAGDLKGVSGLILIAYALIVYPLLGYSLGHVYPNAPTFGLPCPTTIFTFGILMWSEKRPPVIVYIIPILWSLVGTSAALNLGMTEDFGLIVAAVASVVISAAAKQHT